MKRDSNADYEVIIYNLSDEHIQKLDAIYSSTENIDTLNKHLNYDLSELLIAQRFNLIKFQYEVLHSKNTDAKNTISHILELNNKILKY